jgi:hypothetical protein
VARLAGWRAPPEAVPELPLQLVPDLLQAVPELRRQSRTAPQ